MAEATTVTTETKVRRATLRDAEKIHALIRLNSDQLVPRSMGSVVEAIDIISQICGKV